jgi:hypothetical protein
MAGNHHGGKVEKEYPVPEPEVQPCKDKTRHGGGEELEKNHPGRHL